MAEQQPLMRIEQQGEIRIKDRAYIMRQGGGMVLVCVDFETAWATGRQCGPADFEFTLDNSTKAEDDWLRWVGADMDRRGKSTIISFPGFSRHNVAMWELGKDTLSILFTEQSDYIDNRREAAQTADTAA